ncbi:MAG TPA: hypothetical protein VJJ79_03385 [Candidatus Nanoarchaeia archaeon]|nr:hypothetical protein [Candidatus Nanoarchaeia archaeon]
MKDKLKGLYSTHYKKLFFLPLVLLLLGIIILANNYLTNGDIIDKDVSLKGGTIATIYTSQEFSTLQEQLAVQFPGKEFVVQYLTEFSTGVSLGVVVEVSDIEPDALHAALEEITGLALTPENYSVEFIGGSLGESFYQQMLVAILFAFLFMAIVVFVTFRSPVPSFAVVFAAFADMVCTVAFLSLFGMQFSTAGIAAVLLLVGYSIDTDILLTTNMLRRNEAGLFEGVYRSMKTGLTMTAAAFAVMGVGYFVSSSLVIKQMFLIIIVGLCFDVIMTYGMNAGLLFWYLKKKRGSVE